MSEQSDDESISETGMASSATELTASSDNPGRLSL